MLSWNTEQATQLCVMYENQALVWDLRKVDSHVDEVDIDFDVMRSVDWNHQSDQSVILCASSQTIYLYDVNGGVTVG